MEENLRKVEERLNELHWHVNYLALQRDYMASNAESLVLEGMIEILELLGYEVNESDIKTKKVGNTEYKTRGYTVPPSKEVVTLLFGKIFTKGENYV